MIPSALNILYALHSRPPAATPLPLVDFVNLYVRLRHPHHYDPATWPLALWLTFVWPIPFAVIVATRRTRWRAWRRAIEVNAFFFALLFVALLGAGVFYVSETLIQMSLYRFSIYIKLFTCIGAAWWIMDTSVGRKMGSARVFAIISVIVACCGLLALIYASTLSHPTGLASFIQQNKGTLFAFSFTCAAAFPAFLFSSQPALRSATYLVTSAAIVALLVFCWHTGHIGFNIVPEDDAAYVALCQWTRDNTPSDAVFLVPPSEQAMRLIGRRAIVVNFKGVAQLSSEIPAWRDRLQNVLQLPDLTTLPHPFAQTLQAIRARYESLPPQHLFDVAVRYGARYIVIGHELGGQWKSARVGVDGSDSWFLYDLARAPADVSRPAGDTP